MNSQLWTANIFGFVLRLAGFLVVCCWRLRRFLPSHGALGSMMAHHSLAREFNRSQISKIIPVNGEPPKTDPYQRLVAGGFADWRLKVDGLVARQSSFSLAELKRLPSRSQVTHPACEEGWSFIAEWSGVQLSYVFTGQDFVS